MEQPQAFGSLFAQQWRLARIQLVNWGTFCGYHDFPLAENRDDGTAPVIMITALYRKVYRQKIAALPG